MGGKAATGLCPLLPAFPISATLRASVPASLGGVCGSEAEIQVSTGVGTFPFCPKKRLCRQFEEVGFEVVILEEGTSLPVSQVHFPNYFLLLTPSSPLPPVELLARVEYIVFIVSTDLLQSTRFFYSFKTSLLEVSTMP